MTAKRPPVSADGPPGPPGEPEPTHEAAPEVDSADQGQPEPAAVSGAVPPADIIPGVLPGGEVHLFSGSSGAGKTAMIADFLGRLTKGQPVLGEIFVGRPPAHIGFIAADRPWKDHAKWFETVGLPGILHYSLVDDTVNVSGKKLRARTGKGDRFDLFVQSVERLFSGAVPHDSLIVVDPISLFLGGNLIDYDRVYSYMLDLSQYCIKAGVTIVGLCHTSKQKGDPKQQYARPQDRINGTTAQTGCAGTVFHLAPPSEAGHPWYEFTWVPHHAPAETLRLKRGNDGLFEDYTDQDQQAEPPPTPTKTEVKELEKLRTIQRLLPNDGSPLAGPELVTRICQTLGVKKTQAYGYIGKLQEHGFIIRDEAANAYRIPRAN